jgi:hypothetical protein
MFASIGALILLLTFGQLSIKPVFKWLDWAYENGFFSVFDIIFNGIWFVLAMFCISAATFGLFFNARWRHPKSLSVTEGAEVGEVVGSRP